MVYVFKKPGRGQPSMCMNLIYLSSQHVGTSNRFAEMNGLGVGVGGGRGGAQNVKIDPWRILV
jgi:hypothetical protein